MGTANTTRAIVFSTLVNGRDMEANAVVPAIRPAFIGSIKSAIREIAPEKKGPVEVSIGSYSCMNLSVAERLISRGLAETTAKELVILDLQGLRGPTL